MKAMFEALLLLVALTLAVPAIAQSDYEATKARAEAGDAQAQYELGYMYHVDYETVRNYQEAAKWYRLAAEQGRADAQGMLGTLYWEGKGVVQNYQEAIKWKRLAASQGDALDQIILGTMYRDGVGTTQDNIRAYMWFSVASAQDGIWREGATHSRDTIIIKLSRQELQQAQLLATKCFESNFKDCD